VLNIISVFLQLVYVNGNGQTLGPVANAHVTLLELDDPAPAGDDVVVPPPAVTLRLNDEFTVTHTTAYEPNPDEDFGTKITDADGCVDFLVIPNDVGGFLIITSTETNNATGEVVFEGKAADVIPEDEPDFGVTVIDANGRTLAKRMLIALNVAGRQVGTREEPLLVKIEKNSSANGG
jgi:hypothetical protein